MAHVPNFIRADGPIQSIKTYLLKRAVTAKVTQSLSGRMEDLRKLTRLMHTDVGTPGLQNFLKGLNHDMEHDQGMAKLFTRIGKSLNPEAKRKIIENLIFNWAYTGQRVRRKYSTYEQWIPSFMVISPSMRCNLNCTGCYSGLYSKDGELSEEELDSILSQSRKLGMFFVVVTGGEPFVLKDVWLRLFKKYSDMYFLTYTNGTLIDKELAEQLGKLGNVAPAISIEGFEKETDGRRGKGVYKKIMRAMDYLREAGVLFGMSVTYMRSNIGTVTDESFVKHFIDKGIVFAWYFMFMPVGKDPILDLVPTPEQRVACGKKIAELRTELPVFMADFWNDGPAAGGCLAGGRSYFHILNSGRIEPCVFAHFGQDNIRDKTIFEAVNSPFFKAIRNRFPYNENGNLKRPCMIIDNPQVLRDVVDEYLVPAGHEHSEDLIHDKKVVEWIDSYAESFRKLTDKEWEEQIQDPDDRWYKESEEYQELFWFRDHLEKMRGEKPDIDPVESELQA
ncbi:MAG: radical SAM protein [Spirochaetales bacterium]|nr:radical SAM protein [Spirochaetales bacterium]